MEREPNIAEALADGTREGKPGKKLKKVTASVSRLEHRLYEEKSMESRYALHEVLCKRRRREDQLLGETGSRTRTIRSDGKRKTQPQAHTFNGKQLLKLHLPQRRPEEEGLRGCIGGVPTTEPLIPEYPWDLMEPDEDEVEFMHYCETAEVVIRNIKRAGILPID